MRKSSFVLALSCLAVTGSSAVAATPAEQIVSRQQNMKAVGRAFKAISDELKKDAPDLGIVRPYASALGRFGTRVPRWFPAGTGPETGAKTAAKPAVWTDRPGFARAAANFGTASRTLARTARGTDRAATTAAFRALGGTCKGCHDSFREAD